jgi:hypothetical protein
LFTFKQLAAQSSSCYKSYVEKFAAHMFLPQKETPKKHTGVQVFFYLIPLALKEVEILQCAPCNIIICVSMCGSGGGVLCVFVYKDIGMCTHLFIFICTRCSRSSKTRIVNWPAAGIN